MHEAGSCRRAVCAAIRLLPVLFAVPSFLRAQDDASANPINGEL